MRLLGTGVWDLARLIPRYSGCRSRTLIGGWPCYTRIYGQENMLAAPKKSNKKKNVQNAGRPREPLPAHGTPKRDPLGWFVRLERVPSLRLVTRGCVGDVLQAGSHW
jgi:hypothetical protein